MSEETLALDGLEEEEERAEKGEERLGLSR